MGMKNMSRNKKLSRRLRRQKVKRYTESTRRISKNKNKKPNKNNDKAKIKPKMKICT
jgi:hypothetical protein